MTIRVEGLAALGRDLKRLGVDLEDLKTAMAKLADMGAQAAIGHAPKRSGALAGSIRGNRAKSKAVVTAGKGRTSEYAGIINYGSPRIAAQPFMQQASADVSAKVVPTLTADIDRLIREKGLT
jgi:HK97 gp10 family phage protein